MKEISIAGKKIPAPLAVAGGAAVLYVGYRYWSASRNSSEEPVVTAPEEDYGATGSAVGTGYSYIPTSSTTPSDDTDSTVISTNQQWTQQGVAYAASVGYDSAAAALALGKYLGSQPITKDEQNIVRVVLGALGSPPKGGPFTVITDTSSSPSTLTAPTGVKVDSVTGTTVKLSWNSVAGAIGYSVTEAKTGTNVVAYAPSGTSVTVQNLKPNTSYTFYVAARNSANVRQPLSAGVTAKTSGIKLTAPTGLKARTVTSNAITFQWNAVPGVQAYTLQPAGSGSTNIESTDPVQTVTGLKANTTYRYRVAAFQPGTRTVGPWSGYVSVRTKAR